MQTTTIVMSNSPFVFAEVASRMFTDGMRGIISWCWCIVVDCGRIFNVRQLLVQQALLSPFFHKERG